MSIVEPSLYLHRFNCPHCGAFAHQNWWKAWAERADAKTHGGDILTQSHATAPRLDKTKPADGATVRQYERIATAVREGEVFSHGALGKADVGLGNMAYSVCTSCFAWTVWVDEVIVWPSPLSAPLPNEDMPDDVKADYLEAGRIVSVSARGAAALLRLAIQKLCQEVLGKEMDVKPAIDELEGKGLSRTIVKALHIVRVVGNESVHPGTLDVRDNPEMAGQLFELVNRITDSLISQPTRDQELWNALPETKRTQLEIEYEKRLPEPGTGAGEPAES